MADRAVTFEEAKRLRRKRGVQVAHDLQALLKDRAVTNANGSYASNLANAITWLELQPDFKGMFGYDQMASRVVLLREPDGAKVCCGLRPLNDRDVSLICERLQRQGLPAIGREDVWHAIDACARNNSFHPVKRSIEAVAWDGRGRLDYWLSTYLGCETSDYVARIGAMFLISMIARIYEPGCQADHVLILEGPQGAGKSSVCRILGDDWFSDGLADNIGGKDAALHLRGKWLIEVPELASFSKAEANTLKSFITRTEEQYRPPYGRCEVTEPRQCVFIATTNETAYLRDATGGRRFWPVTVAAITPIDCHSLRRDRGQILAEALYRYREHERWWPDEDFQRTHIAIEQEARYEQDDWEELIRKHLLGKRHVVSADILREVIKLPPKDMEQRHKRRVGGILKRLGCEEARTNKERRWNVPAHLFGDGVTE